MFLIMLYLNTLKLWKIHWNTLEKAVRHTWKTWEMDQRMFPVFVDIWYDMRNENDENENDEPCWCRTHQVKTERARPGARGSPVCGTTQRRFKCYILFLKKGTGLGLASLFPVQVTRKHFHPFTDLRRSGFLPPEFRQIHFVSSGKHIIFHVDVEHSNPMTSDNWKQNTNWNIQ